MRKKVIILILLMALTAVVRGSGTVSGWGDPAEKKEIVILMTSLPENMDPARNSSFENVLPLTGIYEGLIRLDPGTLDPEPCLADSWDVSEDGRRWTFHLKPGVLFGDGTPCDAEAVKASMSRLLVIKEKEPYAAMVFNPVSSIETEGKYTVSFILNYPFTPFLKNLALPFAAPVVSSAALSRHGGDFWRHLSGTGPYTLHQMSNGEIVIQANPLYRGDPPSTGRIVFRAVTGGQARARSLLEGKADIIFNPGRENLDALLSGGMKTVSAPGIDVSFIGFYTDRPPFDNMYLRRAVAYALNRGKIVSGVLGGEGVPASGFVPRPVLGEKAAGLPEYDHDQVRRILAREGYPSGVDVTLATYRDSRRYCPPGGLALAEEIKSQLDPCGIRVTIQSRPWSEHKEAIRTGSGDFFLYGWTGDNGDPDNFMYTLLASSQVEHGLNASGYKSDRVDVFLDTARRVTDRKSRDSLYAQAENIILDEVPLTAISHSLVRMAYRPSINGISLSGFGLIDLSALSMHK